MGRCGDDSLQIDHLNKVLSIGSHSDLRNHAGLIVSVMLSKTGGQMSAEGTREKYLMAGVLSMDT